MNVRYLSLSEINFVCFDGNSFEEKFFIFEGKFLFMGVIFRKKGYENGIFFVGKKNTI
jgi:hypothetical protein